MEPIKKISEYEELGVGKREGKRTHGIFRAVKLF
jgi:hypothetical protein